MLLHHWHAEQSTVRLQFARLSGVVDPVNPAAGWQELQLDQGSLAGAGVLGIKLPAAETRAAKSNVDFYVRGTDLVATYGETLEWPLRAQIYWRAAANPLDRAIASMELIATVQTSLLDSRPELMTHSTLPACEAFQLLDPRSADFGPIEPTPPNSHRNEHPLRAACYLFRLPSNQISYAEMVHPADAQGFSFEARAFGADQGFQLRHQLFSERLEKGVILRARVLGVWLDREGDQAAAARHYAAFSASEPLLTT